MKRTKKIRWLNVVTVLATLIVILLVATTTTKDSEVADKTTSYSADHESKALAEIVERQKRSAIKQAYYKSMHK